jgi:hypothetical protein
VYLLSFHKIVVRSAGFCYCIDEFCSPCHSLNLTLQWDSTQKDNTPSHHHCRTFHNEKIPRLSRARGDNVVVRRFFPSNSHSLCNVAQRSCHQLFAARNACFRRIAAFTHSSSFAPYILCSFLVISPIRDLLCARACAFFTLPSESQLHLSCFPLSPTTSSQYWYFLEYLMRSLSLDNLLDLVFLGLGIELESR